MRFDNQRPPPFRLHLTFYWHQHALVVAVAGVWPIVSTEDRHQHTHQSSVTVDLPPSLANDCACHDLMVFGRGIVGSQARSLPSRAMKPAIGAKESEDASDFWDLKMKKQVVAGRLDCRSSLDELTNKGIFQASILWGHSLMLQASCGWGWEWAVLIRSVTQIPGQHYASSIVTSASSVRVVPIPCTHALRWRPCIGCFVPLFLVKSQPKQGGQEYAEWPQRNERLRTKNPIDRGTRVSLSTLCQIRNRAYGVALGILG